MLNSNIAWTDHTLNVWYGCARVSEGCKHCYAARMVRRMQPSLVWGRDRKETTTWQRSLRRIIRDASAEFHTRPTLVFIGSLMDPLDDHAPEGALDRFFRAIEGVTSVHFQLLTKRSYNLYRLRRYDLRNVWLGVTVESAKYLYRIEDLRKMTLAAVRFISYEPAIGPLGTIDLRGIDWVICGGESGPGYRPMEMQWVAEVQEQCQQQGVAFFFKQLAGPRPGLLPGHHVTQQFPVLYEGTAQEPNA